MQPTSLIINDTNYRVYKDSQDNVYPVAPIEEYIIRRVNGLISGQTKIIDFTDINYPVKIESVYIDSPANDQFTIAILDSQDNTIFAWSLGRDNTPLALPTVLITPDLKISLTANSDITKILIHCRPVSIIGLKDF